MLTKQNYIDLYFKEMKHSSADWIVPYYLQMDPADDNYDGFINLDDTVSQQEALEHLGRIEYDLKYLKEEVNKYERLWKKLYKKLSDGKEWTLAVANQTFEEDEEA